MKVMKHRSCHVALWQFCQATTSGWRCFSSETHKGGSTCSKGRLNHRSIERVRNDLKPPSANEINCQPARCHLALRRHARPDASVAPAIAWSEPPLAPRSAARTADEPSIHRGEINWCSSKQRASRFPLPSLIDDRSVAKRNRVAAQRDVRIYGWFA